MTAVSSSARHEDRDTAVVVAVVMAIVLTSIYWISRKGFPNPIEPLLFALGVALFNCTVPLSLARLLERRNSTSIWTSEPVIALGCIATSTVAGMIAASTGYSFALALGIVGGVASLATLVRWARQGRAITTILFVAGIVVFSVWCAGVVWGSRYKMPLFWETLDYKANIHHDTFYYGSIGNMLDTYGVPSTGLDGLPVIRYHFGSPWLYAKLGHLIGVDVLTFYSLGYPIIVLPFFFYSLFVLARGLSRSSWRVWIVVLAATVGFLPTRALDALGIWNSNAFISESYLIGMSVSMLLMASAFLFWQNRLKRTATVGDALYLLLVVPLMLAVDGFLKISLMLILAGVLLYLVIRLSLWRKATMFASLMISIFVVGVTYRVVSLPDQNGGFALLDFMRHNLSQGWQQFFLLFHLLWTWIYLAGRMWEERISDFSQLKTALRQGKLVDAEILALIAIVGVLPGEILSIHGGSAIYFSDVQRWIALAFIIARMPAWTERWRSRHPKQPAVDKTPGWKGIRLATVLGVFVFAPFAIALVVNLVQWPARVFNANITLRQQLASLGGVERSTYYPIVTELQDIGRLPREQRRRSALFIPQSNSQYWSMLTIDGRCGWTPMIAPAITGVAMIDGLPSPDCPVTRQYNMPVYSPRIRAQTPADTTDRVLCAKARSKGFREVLVIDTPPVRRRRVDCYLSSP